MDRPTTTTEARTQRRRATAPTRGDGMRLGRWCSHLLACRYGFTSSFSSRADFSSDSSSRSRSRCLRLPSSWTRHSQVHGLGVCVCASFPTRSVRVLGLDVCKFSASTCELSASTCELSLSTCEFSLSTCPSSRSRRASALFLCEFSVLASASSQSRCRRHRELANESTHGVSPIVSE